MNLSKISHYWQRLRSRNSPPEIPLPVIPLRQYMQHPDPGIVSVESVLPPPSNQYMPLPSVRFLTPGNEHAPGPRTFDRHDTSLVQYHPQWFKPDREAQQL